ncbi:MAG TPA: OmpA family protein [Polyangiaceae bacterium]|nr:MAG: flagellar motor protein MotB [Deltaproteobacteria bacterium ADurb.Bin207]HNS98821.1 OmpA family protein [Polyangiaceae bacterium]HOD21392.1 OmpA family protein [Polyangiaceae bacterium]HOE46936.1 OmpA family protein [Polyangiaceae bacterium]HOG99781.1 OmpA family protein [Polyangiaceae bacterium]
MDARWTLFLAATIAMACSSSPPPRPIAPAPSSAGSSSSPKPVSPEVVPVSVHYRMVQAGPVEWLVDEVLLDASASRCFQARRRQIGGITFESRSATLDHSAFSTEGTRIVALWKGAKQGTKPAVVLHGFADHDEAQSAQAALELSRQRAEAVKHWLVQQGISADSLRVEAHGWDLSPAPLMPSDALLPNHRVEISHDTTPPSEAKILESKAIPEQWRQTLGQRVRALQGKEAAPGDSKLAPRIELSVRDGDGQTIVSFDLASSDEQGRALHRYFLSGLAHGCEFGPYL